MLPPSDQDIPRLILAILGLCSKSRYLRLIDLILSDLRYFSRPHESLSINTTVASAHHSRMPSTGTIAHFTCNRCLVRQSNHWGRFKRNELQHRPFSTVLPLKDQQPTAAEGQAQHAEGEQKTKDESVGALSRRLAEMTEESIESGGRTAQKVMDEAGFSEELKRKLESKILESGFRNENPAAFAQMDMPVRSPILDAVHRMTD